MTSTEAHSIDHRPIIIPKATVDKIMELDDPLTAIGLYITHQYTVAYKDPLPPNEYSDNQLKYTQEQLESIGLI